MIREIDGKAQELSAYAQQLEQELAQARAAFEEQDNLRGSMHQERDQIIGEVERLSQIIRDKDAEIRELSGRLHQLEVQSSSATSSQEGELARLRQLLEECEAELGRVRQDCIGLSQAREELEAACNNLAGENQALGENYNVLMEQLNHFTQLNEEKTHEI